MDDANQSPTSIDSLDLVDLLRRTTRLMSRAYHRRDHAHHAQEHALSIIREKGSIPQSELLERLDVRSSSLSEVLRKLEKNGLILRERSEKDKRSFIIFATEQEPPEGFGSGEVHQESADSFFTCLDDGERRQLWEILNKINQSLENDPLGRESPFGDDEDGRGRRRSGFGRHFKPKGKFHGHPGRGRHGDRNE